MNQLSARSSRKIITGITLSLLFLLCFNTLQAQSLSVFDLDQSAFPTIKAKFYAFDKDGRQVTNLSPSDFEVKEDGVARKVTFVSCPGPTLPVAISSVLVFDVSGSMSDGPPRIQSAKDAANAWVDGLPAGNSECALMSFSDYGMILHDFTKDRQKLKKSIEYLVPTEGTNYNQALIDEPAGGLQIAKTGKYKKVLIFLTDGLPNFEPKTQEIINFANQNDITIYAVTLDMPAPRCIRDMTQQTGGQYFENVTTKKEAEETYQKLLTLAQGIDSCQIEWESKAKCLTGKIKVEVCWNGITNFMEYIALQTSIADLNFNPIGVYFKNKPVGIPFDTTITVTAINSDFNVTNITSDNPTFEITPKSFLLKSGQSRTLDLRFTPSDSSLQFATIIIENDICPKPYYSGGGYKGYMGSKKTLRLVHPNGGETFVVGSDTVITWEGILPSDSVKLEFSTDNGVTWQLITDKATGFEYLWKDIPRPPSSKCLVRIASNVNEIPEIDWQKCLGGYHNDEAQSIIETSDGGFIVAGDATSNDGDVSGNHGSSDYWIVKLSQTGQLQWQKCLGGSSEDIAQSILETSDVGFVVAGNTTSNDGDVSGNHGSIDYWIVKLDHNGQLKWQKCLGGSVGDVVQSITETKDGGFVVAGNTASIDGDVSDQHGPSDSWILNLDKSGQVQWQKSLGGSTNDEAQSIIETSDGGFVVAGYTESNDGDVSGNHGFEDVWIVKLDQDGQLQWQKCLGGSNYEKAQSITGTSDGGFIIAGRTNSNDGDVSGNHGDYDYWILKLDQNGQLKWQKCLGGSNYEEAQSIIETNDGGIVVAGYTQSNDGDVSGNHGSTDYWIAKLDQTGQLMWQKSLGGSKADEARSVTETSDGGIVVAGYIYSFDGDVSCYHGFTDSWVVKLSPVGFSQSDISDSVFSIVMPQAASNDIDLKQCLLGSAKDSLVSNFISNICTYKCRIDSIYFTGADAKAFSLVSGLPRYEIAVGATHQAEFRFRPSRIGVHQAQVVIITQADTLVQNIRGEGVQYQIALVDDVIDFGAVPIGESKDTLQVLTIKNVGYIPINIISTKHIWPNDKDFKTLSGSAPFTLNPGETAKMDLRFTPTEIGRTNGQLEFNFNGPGSSVVVRLFGQGLGGSVVISNDSAYAGDKRKLRLSLGNSIKPKAQSLVTKFKAKLIYNKTLLTMSEPGSVKSTNEFYEMSEITSGWDGSTSSLGEFEVVAGLGNSETTDLIIDEFNWLNDKGEAVDFETETTNGTFKLLGVCREGGSRLINPDGKEMIKSIYPNPSKDEIVINFELTESGYTRLYLTNILGEKVKDIMPDNNPALGQQSINININDLSSGTYYVILETMSGCQSRRVEVVR